MPNSTLQTVSSAVEQTTTKKWNVVDHLVSMGMNRDEAQTWVEANGEGSATIKSFSGDIQNSSLVRRRSILNMMQPVLGAIDRLKGEGPGSGYLNQVGLWGIFPIAVCVCNFIIWIRALQVWQPAPLYWGLAVISIPLIEFYCLTALLSIKPISQS